MIADEIRRPPSEWDGPTPSLMHYPEIPGYEILWVLGESDTAVVYHARFVSLQRPVALKVLDPRLTADPEFVIRLREEAAAAASMDHPNIVRVYACGGEGDLGYVAAELVEGQSLASLVERVPLTPRQASRIATQIAAALDYAHARGVLHRNLSANNVLLRDDFHVGVTDFGMARAMRLVALTVSSRSLDRVAYLSPEQCAGKSIDHSADIYSLGVLLFEMLTGRRPFEGKNPSEVYVKHINEPPPRLAAFSPDLGRPLQRVLDRGLEKDPERRYQSAGQLAADFAEACSECERPLLREPKRSARAPAEPSTSAPPISVLSAFNEDAESPVAVPDPSPQLERESPVVPVTAPADLRPAPPGRARRERPVPLRAVRLALGAAVVAGSVLSLLAVRTHQADGQVVPAHGSRPERRDTARALPSPATKTPETHPAGVAANPPAGSGSSAGGFRESTGTQPVAARKPAPPAAVAPPAPDLATRFRRYLIEFEQYDQVRRQLTPAARSTRLAALDSEIRKLIREGEQTGRDRTLRSKLVRELGTLDWYRSDEDQARARWRESLQLDPANSLASAWLRQTQGAVFNE